MLRLPRNLKLARAEYLIQRLQDIATEAAKCPRLGAYVQGRAGTALEHLKELTQAIDDWDWERSVEGRH